MEAAGIEPPQQSEGNIANAAQGGAESGALSEDSGEFPAELQLVIEAWQTLPETTKVGIVAMVRVAREPAE